MKNFTITLDGTNRHFSIALNATTRRFTIRPGVGPQGPAGTNGSAATVTVGTTTTGNAGTNASVTNSGTTSAAVFNFTIPRGDTGAAGPNTVTSATTTNFTTGQVLYANGTNVGSLSRSGIDTRTTFPNDDVTAATHLATRGALVRRRLSDGFVAFEQLSVADEDGSGGFDVIYNPTSTYTELRMSNGLFKFDNATLIDGVGDYKMPVTFTGTTRQLRCEPIAISSSRAALAGQDHIVTATATLTDPTPSEGAWFRVIVRNGAATLGGTAYATSGTVIERSYHSGAWANRVYNETPVLAANVATFLQTPSSANLAAAVTDETGTGSLVFATSPTLVSATITAGAGVESPLIVSGSGNTLVRLQNTNVARYATFEMLDNGGSSRAGFGYANASAPLATLAGKAYFYTLSRDLVLTPDFNTSGRGMQINGSSGGVSIGTTTDAGATNLLVQGTVTLNGNQIRIVTSQTPASATATGTVGTICWDANYIYVCTATNTWKRAALSTW